MESDMPTTLTLKNIPDAVYDRLKLAAEMHRRSLNSEAIVCLESVLLPTKMMPSERIARARELRATLPPGKFRARDIDAAKREDRP
jgi:plasmid stability protein